MAMRESLERCLAWGHQHGSFVLAVTGTAFGTIATAAIVASEIVRIEDSQEMESHLREDDRHLREEERKRIEDNQKMEGRLRDEGMKRIEYNQKMEIRLREEEIKRVAETERLRNELQCIKSRLLVYEMFFHQSPRGPQQPQGG
mmetsp:Transcript_6231/g.13631  ORF Transcript_6231/g.13631 Transcript_6231/m.13631 type:complete len:144 (-) Transcript_6231:742-1173(-)